MRRVRVSQFVRLRDPVAVGIDLGQGNITQRTFTLIPRIKLHVNELNQFVFLSVNIFPFQSEVASWSYLEMIEFEKSSRLKMWTEIKWVLVLIRHGYLTCLYRSTTDTVAVTYPRTKNVTKRTRASQSNASTERKLKPVDPDSSWAKSS